jgi:hypothetical protein
MFKDRELRKSNNVVDWEKEEWLKNVATLLWPSVGVKPNTWKK